MFIQRLLKADSTDAKLKSLHDIQNQTLKQELVQLKITAAETEKKLHHLLNTPELRTPTAKATKNTRKERRSSSKFLLNGMKKIHGEDLKSQAMGFADYFMSNRELFEAITNEIIIMTVKE